MPKWQKVNFYDDWTKPEMARHIVQANLNLEDPPEENSPDVRRLCRQMKKSEMEDVMWATKETLDKQWLIRYDARTKEMREQLKKQKEVSE